MPRKQAPRKPSQPLAKAVFPKDGRPYRVVEELPDGKEAIEAVIAAKFVGALEHFKGRSLSPPTRAADEWPDFETREGCRKVGIELVEVLNTHHASRRSIQERYARRVCEPIADLYPRLAGLVITLDDGYQDPPYPPLRPKPGHKDPGERLAQSIAQSLRAVAPELESLEMGRYRVYQWQTAPNLPRTGAFARRIAPRDGGAPAIIRFFGSFPQTVTDAQSLLSKTIEGKVKKEYPKDESRSLWLLAYGLGGGSVGVPPSEAATIARGLLQTCAHPFDEVWYIAPYAGEDLGSIEQIWP